MYIVHGEKIKPHFCKSYILAQLVRDNLNERYPETSPKIGMFLDGEFPEPEEYMWDSGGVMAGFAGAFEFYIKDFKVSCKPSQWQAFSDQLSSDLGLLVPKYKNFYKLHAYHSVLCLSIMQGHELHDEYRRNKSKYFDEYKRMTKNI